MVAVDTNVLIRLLTNDDVKQAAAARALFTKNSIWIAKTVLLETGWVLRSLYGLDDKMTAEAIGRLLGLENVNTEDAAGVAEALGLVDQGIEWADAMHLASRPPGATFASFDRDFVRRTARAGATGVSRIG